MFHVFDMKFIKGLLGLVLVIGIIIVGAILAVKIIYPTKYMDSVYKYSEEYDLDPAFVCAVIHAESKFDHEAVSYKGASGLMQLTEPTAYWLAEKMGMEGFEYSDIFIPDVNIHIGCYYLRYLLDLYEGDKTLALAAYNAGTGNVNKWLNDPNYSEDGESLSYIPFKETRHYVRKVERNEKIYSIILKFSEA